MEEGDERELQLLPRTHNRHNQPSSSRSLIPSWPSPLNESSSIKFVKSSSLTKANPAFPFHGSTSNLDLQLSMTTPKINPVGSTSWLDTKQTCSLETLKWQASENIRLAAMEKAYAERVREMTRREMELAQSEFARARHVWEKAREDVERAEKMSRRRRASCMEITCQSCRRKFRP